MHFDYDQLKAFYTVVKEANFQRAAEKLYITQSAVSQRIKALETAAGQALLLRSMPPEPTALGQKFLSVFIQMQALWESVAENGKVDHVKIPVACNTESFDIWFNQVLIAFSKEKNVLFDVCLDDQDQTLNYLRQAKVLGCISAEKGPAQGCFSFPIEPITYVCMASRDFIKKYSLDKDRRTKILTAPTVIYGIHDRIHDRFLCDLLQVKKAPSYRAHTIPSIPAILEQVRESSAYAVLPEELVSAEIKSGQLVDLFPKNKLKIPLYWHCVQTEIPLIEKLTSAVLGTKGL